VLGAVPAISEARPLPSQADEAPFTGVVEIGAGNGTDASVSGDGRFVVFQGPPADPASDSRALTIWLTDLADGSTTDLVPRPDAVRAGTSLNASISGDGCSVVMVTEMALDVFRDDDSGRRWDVYRLVLPNCGGTPGDWELVSIRSSGAAVARGDVWEQDAPSLSRSGSVVAFTHDADHLAVDGLRTISVVDLAVSVGAPLRSVQVAGLPTNAPDTVFVHRGADQPALSGDGRFLAFRSDAASDEPVPRWGDGPVAGGPATPQVFVWDRQQPDRFDTVRLMSASFDGEGAVTGASDPVLSRDGRTVAFVSTDSGLVGVPRVECGDTCATQVFRLDRDSDDDGAFDESGGTQLMMVSAEPATDPPVPGNASSTHPALTADGRTVAFVSKAANLKRTSVAAGGDPATGDLLRWDAATGSLNHIVSVQDITSLPGTSAHPALNDTGRITVYDGAPPGADAGRAVRAMVAPPQLSLADADLGSTVVGLSSDEWYLAVINDGPSSFLPFEVSVDDDQFAINEDGSTCRAGITVPPGGDCVLRLTFTPSAPGPASATIRVSETGFGAVAVEATVSGAGGEPTLRIDPAGADLGTVDIGSASQALHFDVENTSVYTTRIVSVAVSGADGGDFAIVSENCLDRPFNPRAACSVGLVFSPTEPGRRTALVEIRTEDETYATILVAGEGVYTPEIILTSTAVAAGDRAYVGGSGYPANTELTVRFADGPSTVIRTLTNEDGWFLTELPVPRDELVGPRQLVIESGTGVVGTIEIEILENPHQMVGMPGFGLGGRDGLQGR
jgi:Tol biopolymer transport system component